MALFASPFDIFAINHGRHVHHDPFLHDPFLHRRRRRRLLHHGNPFARHDFDSFFNILTGALDDHDHGVNTDKDKAKNKENKAARHHGDVFVFRPEVTENEFGYLLTACVPGVSAADVVVAVKPGGEHGGDDVLTVRSEKHDRIKADLGLPRGASVNAAEISASCIDGVLRVAVPKNVPFEESIVVAAPTSAAAAAAGDDQEMKEKDGDDEKHDNAPAQTIVLQVPGYSRDDITVTRKRGGALADELIVTGKSRSRRGSGSGSGEFTRAYRLTDPDARVTATCADGLLTISIVRPVIAPIVVPVSAERMLPPSVEASGAAAAKEREVQERRRITLMRHAVPGASAGDFKMEVTEGKTLRAHADYSTAGLGRRRFDFAVSLPGSVDRSTLCANVSDGVLTVTAAAPVAPEPVAVKVSGDEPAALLPPAAPPSATPPAAAAVVHEEADGEK